MIKLRLLASSGCLVDIKREGCRPYTPDNDARDRLVTAEVWQNEGGKIFLVPMDNSEGKLRAGDLQNVLIQVAKLRPLDI